MKPQTEKFKGEELMLEAARDLRAIGESIGKEGIGPSCTKLSDTVQQLLELRQELLSNAVAARKLAVASNCAIAAAIEIIRESGLIEKTRAA